MTITIYYLHLIYFYKKLMIMYHIIYIFINSFVLIKIEKIINWYYLYKNNCIV